MKITANPGFTDVIGPVRCFYQSKITKQRTEIEIQEIVLGPSYTLTDEGEIEIGSTGRVITTNGIEYQLDEIILRCKKGKK